jgi:hypothetical protein
MRISGGNLLVGTTDTSLFNNTSGGGFSVASSGQTQIAKQGGDSADPVLMLNQTGLDGEILRFYKDGTAVGNIGVQTGTIGYGGTSHVSIRPNSGTSATSNIIWGQGNIKPWNNNYFDIGDSSYKWKDLYISNRITNSGSGGVRIDTNNHAYIRKKGTQQYQFDCGGFTAGQGKKIFTTGSWTAGGGSITVFQNAGFFGVGQFSFILHYGGCAFTLQHGTSNYATFSVNLNTPGSGQTEVYLTMGYAMTDVKIFLNFDGYPYYGSGALVGSAASGITMTEVSHHTLT